VVVDAFFFSPLGILTPTTFSLQAFFFLLSRAFSAAKKRLIVALRLSLPAVPLPLRFFTPAFIFVIPEECFPPAPAPFPLSPFPFSPSNSFFPVEILSDVFCGTSSF